MAKAHELATIGLHPGFSAQAFSKRKKAGHVMWVDIEIKSATWSEKKREREETEEFGEDW
jgi:hypothetical protein